MKKILSLALVTFFIGSTAVIACDMGESDNMCKAGQIFDPEKVNAEMHPFNSSGFCY